MKLKNNISAILEEKKISIKKLSEVIEMSYSPTYDLVTRDDLSDTRLGTLQKVADYLEVGIDEIYTREEEKMTMNYKNIASMKKYIQDEIAKKGLEDGQIEIDFAGLCEEEETIQAAKELGYLAEKGEGQGVWWIYKEEENEMLKLVLIDEGKKETLMEGTLEEVVKYLKDNYSMFGFIWEGVTEENRINGTTPYEDLEGEERELFINKMPQLEDIETLNELKYELRKVGLSWWTLEVEEM